MNVQPTPDPILWDGTSLGSGALAVVAFPCQPAADDVSPIPLGAAYTDDRGVVLLPHEFGRFLLRHVENVFVCHDAGTLHWLLHGHFLRNDQTAIDALWALSAENRVVDIMLLDQQILAWYRKTRNASLAKLAQRYLKETLPNETEVTARVQRSWSAHASPNNELLDLLCRFASVMHRVYQHLQSDAEKILAEMDEDVLHRTYVEKRDPQSMQVHWMTDLLTQSQDTVPSEEHGAPKFTPVSPRVVRAPYGLLGIGVDVRAAIALSSSNGSVLSFDPDQVPTVLEKVDKRFRDASGHLHKDAAARKCFEWLSSNPSEYQIALKTDGSPKSNDRKFKTWLLERTADWCDVRKEPVESPLKPGHGPWHAHECWGNLAACDPLIAAWQELCRAAEIKHLLTREASVRPTYANYPSVRCNELNLDYLRSLGVPLFRPRPGNVFVVATLEQLKLRCFAAICRTKLSIFNGRLEGYFLTSCDDPLDSIARELFCATDGTLSPATSDSAAQADLVTTEIKHPNLPGTSEQFDEIRHSHPRIYLHYRSLAQSLVELLPLGLPAQRIATILQQVHGIGSILGTEIEQLRETVAANVVYELDDNLWYDSHDRLRKVVGQSVTDPGPLLDIPRNIDRTVVKELRDRSKKGRVWNYIRELRQLHARESFPTDEQIIDRVLRHRVTTLAGRAISPTSATGARRSQYVLTQDEVLKTASYAVVAIGLDVLAMTEDEVVMEVPVEAATEIFLRALEQHLRQAQAKLLGNLAAPCQCKVFDSW